MILKEVYRCGMSGPKRFSALLLISLLLLAPSTPLAAQVVEVGVIGGVAPTRDFANPGSNLSGFEDIRTLYRVDAGGYLVGPTLAVKVSRNLFASIDALYRPLHYEQAAQVVQGQVTGWARAAVVTWQFPVLLRYEMPSDSVRPFVEFGPSFRTIGNLNSARPSWFGTSIGVGVSFQKDDFLISPRVRYTRWLDDPAEARVRTKSDQIELLVALTHQNEQTRKRVGRRVSVGGVLCSYLSERQVTTSFHGVDPVSGDEIFRSERRGPGRFVAGVAVVADITRRWSVEANALSRNYKSDITLRRTLNGQLIEFKDSSSITYPWEFPVLARFALRTGEVRPFVALGPAFRQPKQEAGVDLATFGWAGSVGIDWAVKGLRLAPSLRYTRWGRDGLGTGGAPGDTGIPRDQLSVLASIVF